MDTTVSRSHFKEGARTGSIAFAGVAALGAISIAIVAAKVGLPGLPVENMTPGGIPEVAMLTAGSAVISGVLGFLGR